MVISRRLASGNYVNSSRQLASLAHTQSARRNVR